MGMTWRRDLVNVREDCIENLKTPGTGGRGTLLERLLHWGVSDKNHVFVFFFPVGFGSNEKAISQANFMLFRALLILSPPAHTWHSC